MIPKVNPDIGTIICPFTKTEAVVRRDKRQKLYYVGSAGMVKPNLPDGQAYMEKHTKFFDEKPKQEQEQKPEPKQSGGGLLDW